jgi:hypothetical protein
MVPPATHVLESVEDAPHIKVVVVETLQTPIDSFGGWAVMKTPTDAYPTPEEAHLVAYQEGRVGPEFPRPYCFVWRNAVEGPDEEGLFTQNMSIFYYDLSAPQDAVKELTIPRAALPETFGLPEIVEWGVANGILNPPLPNSTDT